MRYNEIMSETRLNFPQFALVVSEEMRRALLQPFDKDTHGREAHMTVDSVASWIRDRVPKKLTPPQMLSHPKYGQEFENWLVERYAEVKQKLAPMFARRDISAHRFIKVDRDWFHRPRTDLGVYWTYDAKAWDAEIGAYPIWGNQGTDDLIVQASVPHNSVDWIRTIRAHMDYDSGDREYELRLIPKARVNVTSIKTGTWAGSRKRAELLGKLPKTDFTA